MLDKTTLSRSGILIVLAVFVVLDAAWAAGPAIGVATTSGNFQIDRSNISGNATILDGSLIETGRTASELRLYEGTGMRLAGDSRAKVFENRLVLEQGVAQVDSRKGYAIDAAGIQVQAAPSSAARIGLAGGGRVEVAALSGSVLVKNQTGVLLGRVLPGQALAFTIQEYGAAPAEKLTGRLTEHNGHYFLTDHTAGIRVELVGKDLAQMVGKMVEVSGTLDTSATAAPSAAHVVNVITIRAVSVASKAGAAAGAGAKVGSALSSHGVLIAGVAVAAAAAPAAIALTSSDSTPGVSR
jgi:hypothetical protein